MRAWCLLAVPVLFACGSTRDADAAGGRVAPRSELRRAIAQRGDLAAAEAQIERGHPWLATQALAPVLRDTLRRTPAALVVAAQAAAGWDGWAEVESLLRGQPWLDSSFEGEARELLARAALERGDDSLALRQASAAAGDARSAAARAPRLVFLGRALERAGRYDSAAATYARAAAALPEIRDWLLLRAAGALADSAARARTTRAITMAAARARIPWTDAQARERFGDLAGAAAEYASLGATLTALRLRLAVAGDSAAREGIKRQLLALATRQAGSADARTAVQIVDRMFPSLAPDEELTVARALDASSATARAVAAYRRASAHGLLTPADHLHFGVLLARVGQSSAALAELARVTGALAANAAYERARVLMTSTGNAAARAALRDVANRFRGDASVGGDALYLLADLTTDAGDDAGARSAFRLVYARYPASARAPSARFRAAMIAYVHGDPRTAARELDSLDAVSPHADDAVAARYWSGRAWERAGDAATAQARWRAAMDADTTSYYALLAARRLHAKPWSPPRLVAADSFPRVPGVDSVLARVTLLERLGMDVEARFELDALEAAASASPARRLATARGLETHGEAARGIRLARTLGAAALHDARVYRLLFPLPDQAELARDARAHRLNPALVAGIIRQESSFNPHAVSPADARGLMQLLPSVGADVARGLGFPVWDPVLLADPDANLQLGTAHLAASVARYHDVPRVLAAYNAGGARVDRWDDKVGAGDPEVFTERIPFVETRDYVRVVQRNAAMYDLLYQW